jgi:hypothetical protein
MYALYIYIRKWCVGRILNARDEMLQCYSCFSADSDGILVTTAVDLFYKL